MATLTWQNVNAPDLSSSIRTLSDSQNNMRNAFTGAGAALQDWGQGVKNNNTGNIELALSKYGNNADLQAAIQSGALDPTALRNTYGNFDAASIAKYQNQLANDLQNREINQHSIDKTNNLDKFGSQIGAIAMGARQNDPTTMSKWNELAKNGLLGSVAADYAQQIASNLGQGGQDAETHRRNLSTEANDRARTGIEAGHLALENRQWDSGNLGRLVRDTDLQQTLDNKAAEKTGANMYNNIGDSPMAKAKQDTITKLQKEGATPEIIQHIIAGMDKAYNLNTASAPVNANAAAILDSVAPIVQGNRNAATTAVNAKNDSIDTNYRIWNDSRSKEYTDINEAIKDVHKFAPNNDDAEIRNYLQSRVDAKQPLGLAVAAAKNAIRPTRWGSVKGLLFDNNTATIDMNKANSIADKISSNYANQLFPAIDTMVASDNQKIAAADSAVTQASNLVKEMAARTGSMNSPQTRAAIQTYNDAVAAQGELSKHLGNLTQEVMLKAKTGSPDMVNAVKRDEMLKRAITK